MAALEEEKGGEAGMTWSVRASKKGDLLLSTERRPRGKDVTLLKQVEGDAAELLRDLRKRLGAGGTVYGSTVELQGLHLEKLRAFLLGQPTRLRGLAKSHLPAPLPTAPAAGSMAAAAEAAEAKTRRKPRHMRPIEPLPPPLPQQQQQPEGATSRPDYCALLAPPNTKPRCPQGWLYCSGWCFEPDAPGEGNFSDWGGGCTGWLLNDEFAAPTAPTAAAAAIAVAAEAEMSPAALALALRMLGLAAMPCSCDDGSLARRRGGAAAKRAKREAAAAAAAAAAEKQRAVLGRGRQHAFGVAAGAAPQTFRHALGVPEAGPVGAARAGPLAWPRNARPFFATGSGSAGSWSGRGQARPPARLAPAPRKPPCARLVDEYEYEYEYDGGGGGNGGGGNGGGGNGGGGYSGSVHSSTFRLEDHVAKLSLRPYDRGRILRGGSSSSRGGGGGGDSGSSEFSAAAATLAPLGALMPSRRSPEAIKGGERGGRRGRGGGTSGGLSTRRGADAGTEYGCGGGGGGGGSGGSGGGSGGGCGYGGDDEDAALRKALAASAALGEAEARARRAAAVRVAEEEEEAAALAWALAASMREGEGSAGSDTALHTGNDDGGYPEDSAWDVHCGDTHNDDDDNYGNGNDDSGGGGGGGAAEDDPATRAAETFVAEALAVLVGCMGFPDNAALRRVLARESCGGHDLACAVEALLRGDPGGSNVDDDDDAPDAVPRGASGGVGGGGGGGGTRGGIRLGGPLGDCTSPGTEGARGGALAAAATAAPAAAARNRGRSGGLGGGGGSGDDSGAGVGPCSVLWLAGELAGAGAGCEAEDYATYLLDVLRQLRTDRVTNHALGGRDDDGGVMDAAGTLALLLCDLLPGATPGATPDASPGASPGGGGAHGVASARVQSLALDAATRFFAHPT